MTDTDAPKVFISYAWTDSEYSERVLALASRLRDDGVDAIIDKWDLKPGHDANAFMERMVTDPSVKKSILVSNSVYVSKANTRTGGAGIEAQIVTAEIYKSVNQDKFALIAFELDEDGKPFVPAFYGSRIYINLTDTATFEEEYDQLIRWIFERPLHRKPALGKPPEHIAADDAPLLKSHSSYGRAIDAIRNAKSFARAALRDFREHFREDLEAHRLASEGRGEFDEDVLKCLLALRPAINQFQAIVTEIARSSSGLEAFPVLFGILEDAQQLTYRPRSISSFHDWDYDNYKFVAHELMLSATAILIKEDRFDLLGEMIGYRFSSVNPDRHNAFTHDFSEFCHHLNTMNYRNSRLKLNRVSVHADTIHEYYKTGLVGFAQIVEADLLLFLKDSAVSIKMDGYSPSWYPMTLIYTEDRFRPTNLFAKAESLKVANQIGRLLGVDDVNGLKSLIATINQKQWMPKVGFFSANISSLTNAERLGLYA